MERPGMEQFPEHRKDAHCKWLSKLEGCVWVWSILHRCGQMRSEPLEDDFLVCDISENIFKANFSSFTGIAVVLGKTCLTANITYQTRKDLI